MIGVRDEIQRQGLRKRTYSEREGTEGNSYLDKLKVPIRVSGKRKVEGAGFDSNKSKREVGPDNNIHPSILLPRCISLKGDNGEIRPYLTRIE